MQALASRDETYEPKGDALQIPPEYYSWKLATPETVAMAHRHGLEVHIWTLNDESSMREMLAFGRGRHHERLPGSCTAGGCLGALISLSMSRLSKPRARLLPSRCSSTSRSRHR